LARYKSALGKQTLKPRAFYNDSYEVYGANWTADLFNFFEKEKGYDLRLYIGEVFGDVPHPHLARIKSDYREVVASMLLENFTRSWTNWAHQMGSKTKNQAHGSPGNLLDLYAAVDIPETETFGSSYFPIQGLRRDSADVRNVDPDPMMLKFASSGANVLGKTLVSAETFTWLTEHFKTSWAQCKPEVEQLFLSGINHVFYHGTTYSAPEEQWPGLLFYASVNFVPSNSLWSHVDGLNTFVTRTQSVLQATQNANEILLYWPIYDIWNTEKGALKPLTVHNVDNWLHPSDFYKEALALQQKGYSFDFVSDQLLQNMQVQDGQWSTKSASELPYKVLVIPHVDYMPSSSLAKIIDLAKNGARIVFHSLPEDVPGFAQLDKQRAELAELLALLRHKKHLKIGKGEILIGNNVLQHLQRFGLSGETLPQQGLKFIKRKKGQEDYYFIVNHSPNTIDQWVDFQTKGNTWLIMDPLTGKIAKASTKNKKGGAVRVKIKSGESLFFVQSSQSDFPQWPYLDKVKKTWNLTGKWDLHFVEGGPVLPADRSLDRLQTWTSLGDTIANNFSGKAIYRTSFELKEPVAKTYILQLDSLYESAKIKINGQYVGQIWSLPFQLEVEDVLQQGKNTLEIEVANLMANRIRHMDRNAIKRQDYYDSKFVNIDYKPFSAKSWSVMPAGLAGEVKIIQYD